MGKVFQTLLAPACFLLGSKTPAGAVGSGGPFRSRGVALEQDLTLGCSLFRFGDRSSAGTTRHPLFLFFNGCSVHIGARG